MVSVGMYGFKVLGRFSVYNALVAIGACWLSGLTLEQIIRGIEKIEGVKGRFEAVPNTKGCLIIVDYAHTPDGLENILSSVKELARRKVIAVFEEVIFMSIELRNHWTLPISRVFIMP